jgi:hypothetical protein
MGADGVHVTMASTRDFGIAWVVVIGRGSRPPLNPARGGPEPAVPRPCSGRPRACRRAEGRADGKRPGHPRPDARVTDESRIPNPESRH